MGSLKRLSAYFKGWFRQPRRSDFAGSVEPAERIARFIYNHSKLYAQARRAKPAAYLPRNGKTSVFRVDGLTEEDVRRLGAMALRDPAPLAHAACSASTVYECGLHFDPDNVPERHANIVGWPEAKERQKLLAIKLAEKADVAVYP